MKFSEERGLFIEKLINDIHAYPMQRIIGSRMELVPRGRHLMGLCPFHRDRKLGSFLVTPDKGLWTCFTCGDDYSGDAISFIAKYDNISWLEAAFKIGAEEGLCSRGDIEKYTKQAFTKKYQTELQKKFQPKTEKPAQVKVDPVHVHLVYKTLAEISPLSQTHRDHLLNVRKVPVEMMDNFFEFPYNNRDLVIGELYKRLPWLTPADLIKVPGFFYDKKAKKVTYAGYRGIGILIKDAPYRTNTAAQYGQKIAAVQIRKDTVKEGEQRYIWFSSSFAQYETDRFEGGVGCGSPKDVILPADITKNGYSVVITEGKFKALKIVEKGFDGRNIAVSVQGVSTWAGIDKTIKNIMGIVPVKQILIAFDADMMINPAVFKHAADMAKNLAAFGVPVKQLVWLIDEGKGIDDLFNNGKGMNTKMIPMTEAEKIYNDIFMGLIKKYNPNGTTIRDVPDENAEEFVILLKKYLEDKLYFKK